MTAPEPQKVRPSAVQQGDMVVPDWNPRYVLVCSGEVEEGSARDLLPNHAPSLDPGTPMVKVYGWHKGEPAHLIPRADSYLWVVSSRAGRLASTRVAREG